MRFGRKFLLLSFCLLSFLLINKMSMVFASEKKKVSSELVLKVDFENPQKAAQIFDDNQKKDFIITKKGAISGRYSLKSNKRNGSWNEICALKKGYIKRGAAYKISFDYKIVSCAKEAFFYVLVRGKGDRLIFQKWTGRPGQRGTITDSFWNGRLKNPTLVIGAKKQGAILIDNIKIVTAPELIPPNYELPKPKRTWTSKGNANYYIDSITGNDKNDGLSLSSAWRSLAKINECILKPGDKVLLKRGSEWTGYFAPHGIGTKQNPIIIDAYGRGAKPKINAHGKFLATLYVFNSEYIRISNLDIANKGKKRQPERSGVRVSIRNFGTAHDIQLRNLYIHDVNGELAKKNGAGQGLRVNNSDTTPNIKSRYDGLLIEGCRFERVDRDGITFGGYWTRKKWYPNLNVVIRNNHLEDLGGDGIVAMACDGALVEYNTVSKGLQRSRGAAAGIWAWSADNTIIQYNEVSGMKSTRDGQGFDSDWNCRNTIVQYNYSHDNDGGFMLICCPGGAGPESPINIGCLGTIVRYNISQNDGCRLINLGGAAQNSLIYNNVMYVGRGRKVKVIKADEWLGGVSNNNKFYNNVFYIAGEANFEIQKTKNILFENNVFYGNFDKFPKYIRKNKNFFKNPMFRRPGSGANLKKLQGYKLKKNSPYLGKGKIMDNNGGRDYWGNKVPSNKRPDIGANQINR